MAKDLPYFKFFCSEWSDGDITLEDYETQGLFINICSYYWSNECNITFTKLKKKFRGSDDLINELLKAGLIKECINDNVSISFLDEQKEERKQKSKVNSINGAKGGRPKKQTKSENKPNALSSLSETKGIKKREDKKREDNINKQIKEDLFNSYQLIEAQMKVHNTSKKEILKHLTHFWNIKYEGIETESSLNDIRKHFNNWLAKQDVKKVLEPIKHWNQS